MTMSQIRCKCGADLTDDEIIEQHIGTDGVHYRRYQCACGRVIDVPERRETSEDDKSQANKLRGQA